MSEKGTTHSLAYFKQKIRAFLDEPLPRGVNWSHVFGSVLLFLIALQLFTGILLAIYYSPHAATAYESVQYIEREVLSGKLIRGLHHWGASAFVVIIALHILRTFIYAAYKKPRQLTWVLGVFLLLLVMAFAFTGYLLPWDMKAYFATRVGIEIAGSVPVIGKYLARLMQGGNELNTITLTRFYAIHVIVLPLLLLGLAALHVYLVRLQGITPPWTNEGEPVVYTGKFYPDQVLRETVAIVFILAIIGFLAQTRGAPLEAKADPTSTDYIPRPDWYFYGLFQLLRLFPGKYEVIGTVLLPGAFFTALLLWPFLDRNPERRLKRRLGVLALGLGTFFSIVVFTVWGGMEAAREKAEWEQQRQALPPDRLTEENRGDPETGKMLYSELRCGQCHDQPARGVNIPPGLERAGSKYKEAWLIDYLQRPYRIRWKDTDVRPLARMPDFQLSEKEATHLTAFLMQRKDPQTFPPSGFDWTETDSARIEEGRRLVQEYACTGCHVILGDGSNLGPDLSRVGEKLQPDYMYHLIMRPKEIIPDTPMKDNALWEDEAEAIVRYLMTLQ